MSSKLLRYYEIASMQSYEPGMLSKRDIEYMPFRIGSQFLLNLGAEDLERFWKDHPEEREMLGEKREFAELLNYACKKEGALTEYLLAHLPQDMTLRDVLRYRLMEPIAIAVGQGQIPLLEKLLQAVQPEDWERMRDDAYDCISAPLHDHDFSGRMTVLRSMPAHIAAKAVEHRHYLMLDLAMQEDSREIFKEIYHLLPPESQEKYLMSGYYLSRNLKDPTPASEALMMIAHAIGPDGFRDLMMKEMPGAKWHHRGNHDKGVSLLGNRIMIHVSGKFDEGMPEVFEQLGRQDRDRMLSAMDFDLSYSLLFQGDADAFRMVHDALSPGLREEMLKSDAVRAGCAACMKYKEYEAMDDLQDLLSPELMALAATREEKPVPAPKPEPPDPKSHPMFNAELHARLLPIIATAKTIENPDQFDPDLFASKLAVVFNNVRGVDRYLAHSWNGYGNVPVPFWRPVFQATEYTLPEGEFSQAYWQKMLIEFGPAVYDPLAKADKIDAFIREKGISVPETPRGLIDVMAQMAYGRHGERPDFAAACMLQKVTEPQFNRVLDIISGKNEEQLVLKTSSNVPDITIQGEEIGKPGFYMKKLDMIRNVEQEIAARSGKYELTEREIAAILGDFTGCCQSIGHAGEQFTLHGMQSPDSDFYVWYKRGEDRDPYKGVEDKDPDRIVGQSWVWVAEGTPKTLTFDSIEPLGRERNHIFEPFMLEFEKRAREQHGFERVTIGKGGNTPVFDFEDASPPARLRKFDFENTNAEYDSEKQWLVRVKQPPQDKGRQ